MARTACLVCFISTVNDCSNKKEKKTRKQAYPWKAGTSSGHKTNLKQSIWETFDIYGGAFAVGATVVVIVIGADVPDVNSVCTVVITADAVPVVDDVALAVCTCCHCCCSCCCCSCSFLSFLL